ncbi:hypothetical protein [Sinomicrobium soli]|uniref:hypothetical protein n=1 Tax=Sinomicrobium sp. N-1-3-6 TaxID=2219864 RepID=UPI000DCDDA8A|nr:hypothetical protein [Sinomicrobium sp. N-1-3-6]RAV30486.1 hypothetical protein DN748_03025 [Sinomicrobium sp. N-1-3-6]
MILISRHLIPKRYAGLTLWPVIFLKTPELRNDPVLVNHEKIHLRQQAELLVLPFYVLYGLEWLYGLLKYRDIHRAYRQISFEREAYTNEQNPNYLKTRDSWRFTYYFFNAS